MERRLLLTRVQQSSLLKGEGSRLDSSFQLSISKPIIESFLRQNSTLVRIAFDWSSNKTFLASDRSEGGLTPLSLVENPGTVLICRHGGRSLRPKLYLKNRKSALRFSSLRLKSSFEHRTSNLKNPKRHLTSIEAFSTPSVGFEESQVSSPW